MRQAGIRISGGRLRGRLVRVPENVRPTSGRVREALFSMWRDRLRGASVLDLFAGAGVVALEALSRGAAEVVCVDRSPVALAVIASNAVAMEQSGLQTLRLELPEDLRSVADRLGGPFDLVFADPPYAFDRHGELLEVVRPLLGEKSRVAIEHSSRIDLPTASDDLVRKESRAYGESALSIYAVGGDLESPSI